MHWIQVAKQNTTLGLLDNAKHCVQQTQFILFIRILFTAHLEWRLVFGIVTVIFRNISQLREIYKDLQYVITSLYILNFYNFRNYSFKTYV